MTVFADYARYYNLLYRDKDYAGEVHYLQGLLKQHAFGAATILELGCGTGTHAALLAEAGYHVYGIDRSELMLRQAEQRRQQLPEAVSSRLQFSQADISTLQLPQQFDAVISLFHVINYQISNADLQAFLTTAKTHICPGGVFIFDCWYGPAVLSDRPTVRVKRLEDDQMVVTRIAEPQMFAQENRVDVHYQVFIQDKASGTVGELQETHQMRYLFQPELALLCAATGWEVVAVAEWMTGRPAGFDTWGVGWVLRG